MATAVASMAGPLRADAVAEPQAHPQGECWKRATKTWWIGQEVTVKPRLWPGINRPGGHGKVNAIHLNAAGDRVESLDIKYTIERSFDLMIAVEWVDPHSELERGGRSRRRVEAAPAEEAKENNQQQAIKRQRNKSNSTKPKASVVVKKKSASKEVTLPARKKDAPPRDVFAFDDDSSSVVSELSEGPVYKAVTASRQVPAVAEIEPENKGKQLVARKAIARATSLAAGQIHQSPVRTKKAITLSKNSFPKRPDAPMPTNHVTLNEVYAHEVQQARDFIDEVVLHNGPERQAQNVEIGTVFAPALADVCKERTVFESLFFELLVDEGDGQADEDDVLDQVNRMAQQRGLVDRYEEAKVAEYIDSLCEENKIMRSDGQLYSI